MTINPEALRDLPLDQVAALFDRVRDERDELARENAMLTTELAALRGAEDADKRFDHLYRVYQGADYPEVETEDRRSVRMDVLVLGSIVVLFGSITVMLWVIMGAAVWRWMA